MRRSQSPIDGFGQNPHTGVSGSDSVNVVSISSSFAPAQSMTSSPWGRLGSGGRSVGSSLQMRVILAWTAPT